jgi:hypothetical protein
MKYGICQRMCLKLTSTSVYLTLSMEFQYNIFNLITTKLHAFSNWKLMKIIPMHKDLFLGEIGLKWSTLPHDFFVLAFLHVYLIH